MEIVKKANAKINLSLDLTGVLPNGYHAIRTVMQSVTLHDTVSIVAGAPGLRLDCGESSLPADESNTAYKAAKLFYGAAGIAPEADIRLTKRIPSQAGLGGGSADAAAVLLGLNDLYGAPLSHETLASLALKIGADVPFMLYGGTRLCLNVGEITAPLPPAQAWVVIAKPERGVRTADAYKKYDEGAPLVHPDADRLLFGFAAGDLKSALANAGNVFEQLLELPEGETVKNAMLAAGAFYAAMSGSGSAYFGLFSSEDDAKRAEKALSALVPFVCLCKTAPCGVEDE